MFSIRAIIAAILFAASTVPVHSSTGGAVSHRYDVSILGISIGNAELSLIQTSEDYSLILTGGFRFLFWSGDARAVSEGQFSTEGLVPASYRSRFKSPNRVFSTEIDFNQTGVTRASWNTEPPLDPDEYGERVPITDADLIGASDPLSAFMIPARTGAEACGSTLRAFSGVVRFDVDLTALAATSAGVTPCTAAYRPVSGQRLESNEVDRLRDNGLLLSVFELMPGLWAPSALGFETRFGTLMLTRITP